MANCIHEIQV